MTSICVVLILNSLNFWMPYAALPNIEQAQTFIAVNEAEWPHPQLKMDCIEYIGDYRP